jgi:hypothetical protein
MIKLRGINLKSQSVSNPPTPLKGLRRNITLKKHQGRYQDGPPETVLPLMMMKAKKTPLRALNGGKSISPNQATPQRISQLILRNAILSF